MPGMKKIKGWKGDSYFHNIYFSTTVGSLNYSYLFHRDWLRQITRLVYIFIQ
jgi:hypothetical protein